MEEKNFLIGRISMNFVMALADDGC